MAIQMRRGNDSYFDATKMESGEFASVSDTEKLYHSFAAGTAKEVAMMDDVEKLVSEEIAGIKIPQPVVSHTELTERDAADQHPIGAVTGLQEALEQRDPNQFMRIDDYCEIISRVVAVDVQCDIAGYVNYGNGTIASAGNSLYNHGVISAKAGERYVVKGTLYKYISPYVFIDRDGSTKYYEHQYTGADSTIYNIDAEIVIPTDGTLYINYYAIGRYPTVFRYEEGADKIIKKKKLPSDVFSGNVLYGKKWVACGDSFTEGDFTGSTENNTFAEGLYAGEKKVYPFFIGRRNNMTVVNEAKCGSTLTAGGANPLSGDRLLAIPLDADFVTIKIGINDGKNHHNMPLGTINDTENTTFYGAWNVVLDYLTTNMPYAKIGIIVSNGLDSVDLATATIECAKKWGVPYIDLATDSKLPVMLRTLRTNVCNEAKNRRNAAFRVSATNMHPNAKAHEFESYIIEAWLRSI